jgi:Serine endopeptidase inhibitors
VTHARPTNPKEVIMSQSDTKPTPQPFFVRFLEEQEALGVSTDIQAGKPYQTMKWPSDGDEI